jgi:hypothetical protein
MNIDEIRHLTTIDVPTAAKVLGVGRRQAYEAAKRGDFVTLKFGSSLRVPVPALLKLLEGK